MKSAETEGWYLSVIKDKYDGPIANVTQRGKAKTVSCKPRNETQLSFIFSLIIVLKNTTRVIGKRKK